MKNINDVHYHFASYFKNNVLKPYAYLVSKKLSEGHICLNLKEISKAIERQDLLELDGELKAVSELLEQNALVTDKIDERKPFVLYGDHLYLHRYFHYETLIMDRIKALLEIEGSSIATREQQLKDNESFIKELFKLKEKDRNDGLLSKEPDLQLAAAISAVLNNFTIITGGPGTGKTTTVAKILAILFTIKPDTKVALAAPTGKAAARMAQSLKDADIPVDAFIKEKFQDLTPSTIHRLLKTIPDTPRFRHNKDNPLNCDVVIIDESSMIDAALFAKLLDAIGPNTRLILLGDKDQLASVEAGSLFGDLCQAQGELNKFSEERLSKINSFAEDAGRAVPQEAIASSGHPLFQHVIELRYSHRFIDNKGIGRFSKAVINNNVTAIKDFWQVADEQVHIDPTYSTAIFEAFISGYEEYIKEKDLHLALKKLNNLRVLCAIREGDQGLYATNRKIEDFLHRKGLIAKTGEFYENRPIIVTHNYYNLNLFNGDVGILRRDNKGVMRAWFENSDGSLNPVLPGYISQSETVYAMTTHKSQGSEFDQVLVILPDIPDIPILTRELLYTAVTRAKSRVIIQGTEAVILKTAEALVERGSGMIERFIEK